MAHRKSTTKKKTTLSEETIMALIGLGSVLRKIDNRLLAEGKIRIGKNGKIDIIDKTDIFGISK